ncbi:MAG: hypothetical protein MJ196_08585 [Treponemataceae bacterium]|nr:hypothetical protein [Treponemataceae bacterium]
MTAGKRFIIYFAIAAAACATVHFVANESILNLVQQKIYQPAAIKKLEERTDSFTNTVSQYINRQDSLFTLFSGNSVIRNSSKTNLTEEEISERSHFSASLLAETPGLKGIRIINANGKQLFYSTFSEDFTTHEVGAIKYTNYPKNTVPYSIIAAQAGEKGKLTPDLEQKRLIFSYPFYDADLEYRGTIAFYVDAANALRYLIPTDRLGSKTEIVLCNAGNSGLPFGLLFSVPQSAKDLCTNAAIESWEKPGEKIENVKVGSGNNFWVIFSKKCEDLGFVSMVYPEESLEMPQKSQQYIIWATMFFICFVTFICWAAKTETERKKTKLLEEDVASKKKVEKIASTPMAEALRQQEKLRKSQDFAWNNGETSENTAEKTETDAIPGEETEEASRGLLHKAEKRNENTAGEQAEKPLKFKQALTPNFDLAKPAETESTAGKTENTENLSGGAQNENTENMENIANTEKNAAQKAKEEKLLKKQQAKQAKIAAKLKKKQDKAQEKAQKEVAKLAAIEAKKQAKQQPKTEKAIKTTVSEEKTNIAAAGKEKPAAQNAAATIAEDKKENAKSAQTEQTAPSVPDMEETAKTARSEQDAPAAKIAETAAGTANTENIINTPDTGADTTLPQTAEPEIPAHSAPAEPAPVNAPVIGNIFEYSDNYSEEEGFTEIADYVLDDEDLEVYKNLEEPVIAAPAENEKPAAQAENAKIEEEAGKTAQEDTAEEAAETAADIADTEIEIDDDFDDIVLDDISLDDFENDGETLTAPAAEQPAENAEKQNNIEEKLQNPAEQAGAASAQPQNEKIAEPAAEQQTEPKLGKPIQPAKSHLASLFKERMEQNSANPGISALQTSAAEEPLTNALFTLDLSKNSEKNYKFDNNSLSFAQKNDEHLVRAKQQSMAAAGKKKGDLPVQVTEAVMDRVEVQDEDYIEELEPLAEGEVYTSIFTVGSGMPLFQFGTSQRAKTGRSNYAEAFEQASRTLKMAAYNEAVPDTIKESNGIFMINGIDETMPVKINYDFKRLVDSVLNV